jgi:hypothetical protein
MFLSTQHISYYIFSLSREWGIFFLVFICPSSRPFFVFLFPFCFGFRGFKMQWIYAFPGATSTSTPAGGAAAAKSAQHFWSADPPGRANFLLDSFTQKPDTVYTHVHTHTHRGFFFFFFEFSPAENPSVFFFYVRVFHFIHYRKFYFIFLPVST